MNDKNRQARSAGILYLLLVLVAPIRLLYIPTRLFDDSATTTMVNILAHESLFRFGMVAALMASLTEVMLAFALYWLFREVDRRLAIAMVVLAVLPVPVDFANLANDAAALLLARGDAFLAVLDPAQRAALGKFFLKLRYHVMLGEELFWGLWLLPLAALIWKSQFLPRFLAIWVTLNGIAYIALSLVGLLAPQYDDTIGNIAFPLQLGEVALTLWLLIFGARRGFRSLSAA